MPPPTLKQTFDLALRRHRAGRLREAEQLYRQILAQEPKHAEAIHLLGLMAHQLGRNDVAIDLIGQATVLRPNDAEAHCNLANALNGAARFDEAIIACRRAMALRPDFPEAINNLAIALRSSGRIDEAIAAFRQAIALRPAYAEAHGNLGNALNDAGQFDEAIGACRRALAQRPDSPEARNTLGIALEGRGEIDEAIAAFREAIALRPSYAEAHSNLGNALREQGRLDDAAASLRRAVAINPNLPEGHGNFGNVLKDQGRLDEAIAAYRQAVAVAPSFCKADGNLIYLLHFHPNYSARRIAGEHRRWSRQHAETLRSLIPTHSNDRSPDRRLRIGYVSPDFWDHVVGRNLLPLFRCHDHRQFEVICYANVSRCDGMTREFQQHADRWRHIVALSDEQVARQIQEDRIDVLVDLALHMAGNRLLVFARKPAPVQATFAGYPGSTGLTAIDYRLSDPYLDPLDAAEGGPPGMDESIYSERTIRLPDSFWCYDPLDAADIAVNPLPALHAGVVTFGCLNNFCKINDAVLALWARVLGQVEGSRLLLLTPPGSHRQRTVEQLSLYGVAPGRIEFVANQARREYLKLYRRTDVELDSFPYNGHTTSLDSLWMGVPVVTLAGETAVSRAGWSQLSNLGLTELAAQAPEQFVKIAVELAGDLPRLSELRSTLRGRMERSPVMDAPKFARGIESAYRQMWRTWCEKVQRDR